MKQWHLPLILAATLVAVLTPLALSTTPTVEAATASVFCDAGPTTVPAPEQSLQSYTPINPVRLVDTRNNIGGLSAPIDRGCTMRVDVSSDVPNEATAIALSLTAVSDEADYFAVYPCALGRPETSNLNSRAGVPTPNLVVAIPDANRQICVFSHGTSHLIVDLAGWWSDSPDRFASVEPQRVYDSRRPGFAQLVPDTPREITIPASVVPDATRAAVVNLTTTRSGASGFMVAYPCSNPVPLASNLNFVAGEDRAVGAIVGLGPGRKICVLANVATDVIVDVTGYYGPAPDFGPTAALNPSSGRRILDTRNGIGGPRQPFGAFEIRAIDPVAGLSSSDEASAVMLNFISTNSSADGYLSVFPCGGPVPEVSSLNFTAGSEATNLATVKLGADRTICILASAPTDIVVDVFGVMAAPEGSFTERMSFDKPVWPTFDPAATDYAIECDAGTTTLGIDLELLPFTTATVNQPLAAVGSGPITRQLRTDDLLTVKLTRQGEEQSYHFRCLPTDFPKLTVDRPGEPSPGWYLTTFGIFGSPSGPYSVILDHYGAPVWYKKTPEPVFDFKRLSDGKLVYNPALGMVFGTQPTRGHWITRLDGTFVRQDLTVDPADFPDDHHDYVELPGGGRAMLTYPLVDPVDLTELNSTLAGQCTVPAGHTECFFVDDKIVDGVIQEIDSGGNLVWQWKMTDHFDVEEATFPVRFPVYQDPGVPDDPGVVDIFHINALDRVDDGTGDYIVTSRHLDAAFRVEVETGNVKWIVGMTPGARPNLRTPIPFTYVNDPLGGPKRPHDARLEGDILTMFDNRTASDGPARAVAYRIDAINHTATLIWSIPFPGGFPSGGLGSVRVGPDGSRLVTWGQLQPMFEEYDAAGERMMSITQSPFGFSYRIVKYPIGDFDVDGLRANAGGSADGP